MRLFLMFALVASAGCAGTSHPGDPGNVSQGVQVQQGREFDVAVGQEVRVQGTEITLRFNSVPEDSRCAIDVQCVWAGNAVVRLTLSAAGKPAVDAALNTTLDPRSTSFEGYSVFLRGLKPQPRSGTAMPSSSYVASLEVSR